MSITVTTVSVSTQAVILHEARIGVLKVFNHMDWLLKVGHNNQEWVDMICQRRDSFWAAELCKGERKGERFIVLPRDAYNFDIEMGLPVLISIDGVRPKGVCKIAKRLKNNKKYIKI